MDKLLVVFTMKGCPYCVEFKELLMKEDIQFHERDIDDYEEEYEIFTKITENDMVPALLIIEGDLKKHKSYLYAPERNYEDLTEAVEIIKKHRGNSNVI